VKRVIETKEVAGQSPNYLLAKFQDLVDWAVNSSRAQLAVADAVGPRAAPSIHGDGGDRYDFAPLRNGAPGVLATPGGVLILRGPAALQLAPVIRRIYDQMPQPNG